METGTNDRLATCCSGSGTNTLSFAFTVLDDSFLGQEVSASFLELDTLGSSDLVSTGRFNRASLQSSVVESAIVPAPVPLVLTAVCLSATRRLRRLSARLRQHRVKR